MQAAGRTEQGGQIGPETDPTVQLGVVDSGEGPELGEASMVNAWSESGNVLVRPIQAFESHSRYKGPL